MEVMQFMNNRGETLEQGDVVVFGERLTSIVADPISNIPVPEVDIADHAYDTRVCGIVSEIHAELKESDSSVTEAPPVETTKKGKRKAARAQIKAEPQQLQAFTQEQLEELDRTKIESGQIGWMVVHGLYAYCKVDADISPVQIGDLLTTSPTRGHAQKVLEPGQAVGAILGKALGSLKKGKGKIAVLVRLQ